MHLRCYHTRIEDLKDQWNIERVREVRHEITHDRHELDTLWNAAVCRESELIDLSFTWHVELNRRQASYPKTHVEYQIEIYQTPDIKQEGKLPRVYPPFVRDAEFQSRTYAGKEKKAAKEYALKCAEHYKVSLEGNAAGEVK